MVHKHIRPKKVDKLSPEDDASDGIYIAIVIAAGASTVAIVCGVALALF